MIIRDIGAVAKRVFLGKKLKTPVDKRADLR